MPELTPEQRASQQIDAQLVACGWVIQDYRQFNPAASRGIALREAPLKSSVVCRLLYLTVIFFLTFRSMPTHRNV